MKKPKIVILGAGFGGVYALLNMVRDLVSGEADVTIINRTNYFLFTPLLHEVATGSLAHNSVIEALRSIVSTFDVKLVVGEIERVETADKVVKTNAGDVPYDILVIALGSTTNFFGTPGAREHALVLKNLSDASTIRNTLISTMERALQVSDPVVRRRLLNFVIIGGGATGVELAAEMADLFFKTFGRFYRDLIQCEDVHIHLSTDGPDVLSRFHPHLRARAQKILQRKGVRIHAHAHAVRVEKGKVSFADGTSLEAETIMWTAGVVPVALPADIEWPKDTRNRLVVDSFLQVEGHPNIFAIGDMAVSKDVALPPLAQVAVAQGTYVGRSVVQLIRQVPREPFSYKSRGDLVSLGFGQAVADVFGVRWSGPLAWFMWRTVYLTKFLSWPKKIRVAAEWTINLFYPRDITKT